MNKPVLTITKHLAFKDWLLRAGVGKFLFKPSDEVSVLMDLEPNEWVVLRAQQTDELEVSFADHFFEELQCRRTFFQDWSDWLNAPDRPNLLFKPVEFDVFCVIKGQSTGMFRYENDYWNFTHGQDDMRKWKYWMVTKGEVQTFNV